MIFDFQSNALPTELYVLKLGGNPKIPSECSLTKKSGDDEARTRNLRIDNPLRYQYATSTLPVRYISKVNEVKIGFIDKS